MFKQLFFMLALCFCTAALSAQAPATIELPAPVQTEKCQNVTVEKHTLTAVYPDVDFTLSFRDMRLYVTCAPNGSEVCTRYDAIVSEVGTGIYRAEITPDMWFEINSNTGIALVLQHCFTRVFTPAINLFSSIQGKG